MFSMHRLVVCKRSGSGERLTAASRMAASTTMWAVLIYAVFVVTSCGLYETRACNPGSLSTCVCSDGRFGYRTCDSSGSGFSSTCYGCRNDMPRTCSPGLTSCSGACVDLAVDGTNCGACGLECPQTHICSNSTCVSVATQPSPRCNDGVCNGSETCSTCARDCGTCRPYCGDGTCNGGETCANCTSDCGNCPGCGDGTCNGNETCYTCVNDCGTCVPRCGDGVCSGGETCSTCAMDCGVCAPRCGDGVCSAGETCSTCAADCGSCVSRCGDGTCSSGETCSTCPVDCNGSSCLDASAPPMLGTASVGGRWVCGLCPSGFYQAYYEQPSGGACSIAVPHSYCLPLDGSTTIWTCGLCPSGYHLADGNSNASWCLSLAGGRACCNGGPNYHCEVNPSSDVEFWTCRSCPTCEPCPAGYYQIYYSNSDPRRNCGREVWSSPTSVCRAIPVDRSNYYTCGLCASGFHEVPGINNLACTSALIGSPPGSGPGCCNGGPNRYCVQNSTVPPTCPLGCTGGQLCVGGRCECPIGQNLCGGVCTAGACSTCPSGGGRCSIQINRWVDVYPLLSPFTDGDDDDSDGHSCGTFSVTPFATSDRVGVRACASMNGCGVERSEGSRCIEVFSMPLSGARIVSPPFVQSTPFNPGRNPRGCINVPLGTTSDVVSELRCVFDEYGRDYCRSVSSCSCLDTSRSLPCSTLSPGVDLHACTGCRFRLGQLIVEVPPR